MAETILNSLTTPAAISRDRQTSSQQRECWDQYLKALGLTREVEGVVHVAGTKGKGSICASVEGILRRVGYRMGLFTSPHLYDVRERIQIQGDLIQALHFDRLITQCYRQLSQIEGEDVPFPGYFTFLTLAALRAFKEGKCDGVILEVGIGGRYDPTNLVWQPWVCGMGSIGYDHMNLLGSCLEDIAWQKAGILKPNVPAYSVPQKLEVMTVLKDCAAAVGTTIALTMPQDWRNLDEAHGGMRLRGFQLENAAVAVRLAQQFEQEYWKRQTTHSPSFTTRLESLNCGVIPAVYLKGLADVVLPGRAQIVAKPLLMSPDGNWEEASNVTFYVDGAHTPESLEACVDWIQPCWHHKTSHHLDFLLFNCHQLRDPAQLLKSLHQRFLFHQLMPDYTLFPPLMSPRAGLLPIPNQVSPLEWQKTLFTTWAAFPHAFRDLQLPLVERCGGIVAALKARFPGVSADIPPSLPAAMKWLGAVARQKTAFKIRVLATGSLYFVSDVLKLIQHQHP